MASDVPHRRDRFEPRAARSGLLVHVDDRLRDASPRSGGYVPIERDRVGDPDAYRARLRDYREGTRLEQLAPRVEKALDEWIARRPGGRLAVFCHGSVINVFAARVLGLAQPAFLEAGYASGHRFLISSGGLRSVRSLNETAYLAERG
jgi:probable phosphoglycerate mutase